MKFQFTLLAVLLLQACGSETNDQPVVPDTTHANMSTNIVAIPHAVRSNLGITFATVERRNIQDTLRVPGTFEYLPSAKTEYRTMLPGKVELLVEQFEHVKAGTPLYKIDSPTWRETQQTIALNHSAVVQLQAKLEMYEPLFRAHAQHEESLKVATEIWENRIENLNAIREAGGGDINEFTRAIASLAEAQSEIADALETDARFQAEFTETKNALKTAITTNDFALESAVAMMNIQESNKDKNWWKTIKSIEVRATRHGVVEFLNVTNGAWIDERTNVLTVVQPDRLRFHASGLQSDLGILRDGLMATIVPPTPTASDRAVPLQITMQGTLSLGLVGDANKRTIDLYVTPEKLTSWARPGVSAQLEIVTDSTRTPELSIPLAAVQQDGLIPIIFRRNPSNQNEAIRMEADLGLNDGRWVAILSGLVDGDEVVLDGGFQLMLATTGSIQQGGHFHSDGTFHEEGH